MVTKEDVEALGKSFMVINADKEDIYYCSRHADIISVVPVGRSLGKDMGMELFLQQVNNLDLQIAELKSEQKA